MTVIWTSWSIVVNRQWQYTHVKGNRKGKVNEYEVLDALAMLGMIVLNVVHE